MVPSFQIRGRYWESLRELKDPKKKRKRLSDGAEVRDIIGLGNKWTRNLGATMEAMGGKQRGEDLHLESEKKRRGGWENKKLQRAKFSRAGRKVSRALGSA